jgi:hypothetical protein
MWLLRCKREVFIFFNKIYKVHSVEVLSQDPRQQKNFSLLIITDMDLKFEPYVLNLVWKWCKKDPKNKKEHLIFINFGVKKFIVKNTQNHKNFDVWMLYSPEFHGMRSWTFLRLIPNKATSWSYDYFLKFSYFYFLRKWYFQLCQKLQSLVKKTQGILGVN